VEIEDDGDRPLKEHKNVYLSQFLAYLHHIWCADKYGLYNGHDSREVQNGAIFEN